MYSFLRTWAQGGVYFFRLESFFILFANCILLQICIPAVIYKVVNTNLYKKRIQICIAYELVRTNLYRSRINITGFCMQICLFVLICMYKFIHYDACIQVCINVWLADKQKNFVWKKGTPLEPRHTGMCTFGTKRYETWNRMISFLYQKLQDSHSENETYTNSVPCHIQTLCFVKKLGTGFAGEEVSVSLHTTALLLY